MSAAGDQQRGQGHASGQQEKRSAPKIQITLSSADAFTQVHQPTPGLRPISHQRRQRQRRQCGEKQARSGRDLPPQCHQNQQTGRRRQRQRRQEQQRGQRRLGLGHAKAHPARHAPLGQIPRFQRRPLPHQRRHIGMIDEDADAAKMQGKPGGRVADEGDEHRHQR